MNFMDSIEAFAHKSLAGILDQFHNALFMFLVLGRTRLVFILYFNLLFLSGPLEYHDCIFRY